MVRYRYNQQVSPPGPFVHVTLRRPLDEGSELTVPAQMDTAADLTVIPWRVVEELGLLEHDRVEALGFGGHVITVSSFLVQIRIHDFAPQVVEALSSREEPYVLLGRDVLNTHRILLDGPGLMLEIG